MKSFRLRLPLYLQLLSWFFLNLLLLGLAAWILAVTVYGVTWDTLLKGPAGEHLRHQASQLVNELNESERADWNGILQSKFDFQGIETALLRPSGEYVAGAVFALPSKVAEKLKGLRIIREDRPPPRLGHPPPEEFPPARSPGESRRERPRENQLDGRYPMEEPLPGREPWRRNPPGFLVRDGKPVRYWIGMVIHLRDFESPRPRPYVLVLASNSLAGGGLIFNFTPLWVVGGAVLFSALFWIPFVVRITRTIAAMNRAAERIADGGFDVQLGTRWGDEMDTLAGTINHLAAQLRRFVTGQKRFLGDVAHELCSPLARMEMALGVLEQRADARQKEYVNDVRDEVRVMSGLVNELLDFSKAGLAEKSRTPVPVDLSALVPALVLRETAGGDQVETTLPEGVWVMGHGDLITRALGNVLRNAIRYASAFGPIDVSMESAGDHVTVWVRDQGPGVAPEALAKLGEPFFRPDTARTREEGGFGLGLAIVKSCVAGCGGTIEIQNRIPRGLEVGLRFRATSQ